MGSQFAQLQGSQMNMKYKTVIFIGLALIMTALMAPSSSGESTLLKWYPFKEGVALGKSQGKILFVHFWADWCTYCHTMEKETFQNPAVMKMLAKDFISIKVDTDQEKALSDIFKVRGLPDNWFLSENGDIVGHRPGYITVDVFMKILESVSGNEPKSR